MYIYVAVAVGVEKTKNQMKKRAFLRFFRVIITRVFFKIYF